MYCPRCGKDNPDSAQVCSACNSLLPALSAAAPAGVAKTSGLAIASFVLGILSLLTLGLTAIPAIVLGIVGLVAVEKSGGKLKGRGLAIGGIVVPVVLVPMLLMVALLLPASSRARQTAFRTVCATNLSGIGKAMLIYANDYDDELPRSGGRNSKWARAIPMWNAPNRFRAYGLAADGSGGQGNISSCFYLLVKYVEVTPKSFVCKRDVGASVFDPAEYARGDAELIDFWDFGTDPSKHCSYSYHQPFSLYPLPTSSEPGMAVAADRNPWMASPASDGKSAQFGLFNPAGAREAIKAGNAIQHKEDGQNVLFLDSHVGFEKVPFCGVNDDNIYTFWDGSDIRRGGLPVVGASEPSGRLDSFLVHDGH